MLVLLNPTHTHTHKKRIKFISLVTVNNIIKPVLGTVHLVFLVKLIVKHFQSVQFAVTSSTSLEVDI